MHLLFHRPADAFGANGYTSRVNEQALIDALDRFGLALPHVVAGLSADDARWRPDDGAWSVLEVLAHLADEEVEDFRRRVRLTLEDPQAPWPPIDPPSWARERRYNDGEPAAVLRRFGDERAASVRWLRSLKDPNWQAAYQHPRVGPIAAGEVMASWVAHDALHLRQIAKRLYQLAARDGAPFGVDYAGTWSA
jgi:hypothetical protein